MLMLPRLLNSNSLRLAQCDRVHETAATRRRRAERRNRAFGIRLILKAGAEAQALAEALSNYHDIDRALAAYNAARQPLSERIVSHGRKLGMQLGVGIETDEDRKFAKSLQSPKGSCSGRRRCT